MSVTNTRLRFFVSAMAARSAQSALSIYHSTVSGCAALLDQLRILGPSAKYQAQAGRLGILIALDMVSTSSYIGRMAQMKTVGVKILKNKLSEYLREVKRGTVILVTDRGTVVAELREPSVYRVPGHDVSLTSRWSEQGLLRLPLSGKKPLPITPISLPEGTAQALLNRDRDE